MGDLRIEQTATPIMRRLSRKNIAREGGGCPIRGAEALGKRIVLKLALFAKER
jgi:hypothetical protein